MKQTETLLKQFIKDLKNHMYKIEVNKEYWRNQCKYTLAQIKDKEKEWLDKKRMHESDKKIIHKLGHYEEKMCKLDSKGLKVIQRFIKKACQKIHEQ